VNENIYGRFAEDLGRGIYEGIWVGPDSEVPNTRGIRDVAALKELNIPVLRQVGGRSRAEVTTDLHRLGRRRR